MDLNQLKIDRGPTAREARRRKSALPIGWIVTIAIVAVLLWLFRTPLIGTLDGLRLPKVTVIKATKSTGLAASAVAGVAANGYIVASKRAALSADTPGRIVELNVQEGSVVKKGQVVARLYADEYRAALKRTQADLESARAVVERSRAQRDAAKADIPRLEAQLAQADAAVVQQAAVVTWAALEVARWDRLATENIENKRKAEENHALLDQARAGQSSVQAGVEAAKASVQQAVAQVASLDASVREAEARLPVIEAEREQAQATLDKTEVRAPFDGVVVLKDAEVGEVVSPNSQGGNSRGSVCTMVDLASLEVQVELSETSIAAVSIDAPAKIYLDAYPSKLYTGQVERIWPTANRQKQTIEVRVSFDTPDGLLRPEMGARVVFSPEREGGAPAGESAANAEIVGVILIPTDCVVKIDGRPGVFELERNLVRWREVGLGEESGGRVAVVSGLLGGELIVAKPSPSLEDGDKVQIED